MAKHGRKSTDTSRRQRLKAHLTASKAGAAPGTLQYVGQQAPAPTLAVGSHTFEVRATDEGGETVLEASFDYAMRLRKP